MRPSMDPLCTAPQQLYIVRPSAKVSPWSDAVDRQASVQCLAHNPSLTVHDQKALPLTNASRMGLAAMATDRRRELLLVMLFTLFASPGGIRLSCSVADPRMGRNSCRPAPAIIPSIIGILANCCGERPIERPPCPVDDGIASWGTVYETQDQCHLHTLSTYFTVPASCCPPAASRQGSAASPLSPAVLALLVRKACSASPRH